MTETEQTALKAYLKANLRFELIKMPERHAGEVAESPLYLALTLDCEVLDVIDAKMLDSVGEWERKW